MSRKSTSPTEGELRRRLAAYKVERLSLEHSLRQNQETSCEGRRRKRFDDLIGRLIPGLKQELDTACLPREATGAITAFQPSPVA